MHNTWTEWPESEPESLVEWLLSRPFTNRHGPAAVTQEQLDWGIAQFGTAVLKKED